MSEIPRDSDLVWQAGMHKGAVEHSGRSLDIKSPTPGGPAEPVYGFHPRADHPPISGAELAQAADAVDSVFAELVPRPEDILPGV